jgi:dTDP-4-amino-4,6-dideoxygalactose transaminase
VSTLDRAHPARRLSEPVYVTRPVMPPLEQYTALLEQIWRSGTLTNLGPLHELLEERVRERIGRGHVSIWNNGTAALQGMLAQFRLSGEVIVTPFTFPATVHAIALMGLEPVFADVDPVRMTLDPESVRERITPRTSAILGTHIYGIMCDTVRLAEIARERGLALLFDGAHSFASTPPLFAGDPTSLGDATMLSFHATKLFHTVEGGAVVTPDAATDEGLRRIRNFGIEREDVVRGVGLNGKMSELHAAMGILMLDRLETEIEQRRVVAERYARRLLGVPGLTVAAGLDDSAQYFVIRVRPDDFGATRDVVHARLREHNIMSRKYFFPLCSDIDEYAQLPSAHGLTHARAASEECLALPFFGALPAEVVDLACDVILAGVSDR